jgi:hypothetical protein
MGLNKKSERMKVARWQLERSFVEPYPKFEVCSRLLYLFMTSSDKLSRKNILYSEAFLQRFRDSELFQKDPLFEQRAAELAGYLRHAKDRLLIRESRLAEKAAKADAKIDGRRKAAPEPPTPGNDVWDL